MFVLETRRLRLRQLQQNDFADLARMLQDPLVMTAYEGPFEDKEVQDWIDRNRVRYTQDGIGFWAVEDKATGAMLGQTGLTRQEIPGATVTEVGYMFMAQHWHCGYAQEAALACKQYAFEVLGEPYVYSLIRDSNLASQKVALRCGMRPSGTMVKHYRGVDMPHIIFRAASPVLQAKA